MTNTEKLFSRVRGSPISRPLSSTKNLPCTKKEIFFRVIIFNDNRDFRLKFSIVFYTKTILATLYFTRWRIGQRWRAMRVTIRMGRGYSFCVALSLFNSSGSLKSDKLNLLYIKSVLSATIQSFQKTLTHYPLPYFQRF